MIEKTAFSRFGRRRGVSPVIAVVLIIALTVAAAGTVWLVTNNFSSTSSNVEVLEVQTIYDENQDNQIDRLTLKVKNTGDTVSLTSVLISTPDDYKAWHLGQDYGVSIESQENAVIHIYANQSTDQLTSGDTVSIGLGASLTSLSFTEARIQGTQGTVQPVKVRVTAAGKPVAGTSISFLRKDGLPSGVSGLSTDSNGEATAYVLPNYYKIRTGSGQESKYFHSAENKSISFSDSVSSISVKVLDGSNAPISGITVYVTDGNRNEIGTSGTTNSSGIVEFSLGSGTYYFRVNYLGSDYFSSQISVPIPLGSTNQRTIKIGNSDLTGIAVFGNTPVGNRRLLRLFTETNTSMGRYVWTNSTSGFSFTGIPSGFYRLRLDYGGKSYWSTVISTSDPNLLVNFGGGDMTVYVSVGGSPLPNNVLVRLFHSNRAYAYVWARINSTGWANFGGQPKGDYTLRIDWLNKYTFTSNFTHNDPTPHTVTAAGGRLYVLVKAGGTPLPNRVLTRLFNEDNTSAYRWARLNSTGWADYGTVLEGTYRLRVDWLNKRVFTGTFVHTDEAPKTVDMQGAKLILLVTSGGTPLPNRVLTRLFNADGTYTGLWARTNSSGYVDYGVVFDGTYKLRIDWLAKRTFTSTFVHSNSSVKTVSIPGGNLEVKVNIGGMPAPERVLIRLFNADNSSAYRWARVNATGIASFGTILSGLYRIRVDWLGKRVLSSSFNHSDSSLKVVNMKGGNLTIAFTAGGYAFPNRVLTRLFNTDGTYTGKYAWTNSTGYGAFGPILEGTYKIRVDWMGQYVFSTTFVHQNDSLKSLDLPGGNFTIGLTIGGGAVHDRILVRVFLADSTYTGRYAWTSGGNGTLAFGVALNGTYKFRLDYMSLYTYSASTYYFNGSFFTLDYEGYSSLVIKVVDGNNGNSLFPTNTRIWMFTSTGSYTGRSGVTNSSGWVTFTDIINGTFKLRVGSSTFSNVIQLRQGITVAIPGGVLLGMQSSAEGGTAVIVKRGD